jgi:hypothetical protein
VDDGTGGGQRLMMIVQAEAGKLGDTKLLAQDAGGVVVLKNPIFETRLDAARAFEQGILCGVEELLGARKKSLARVQELEFVMRRVN